MSRPTQDTAKYCIDFVYGTITRYGSTFQKYSTINTKSMLQSYNPPPAVTGQGLGSSPFARRYSGNHVCFLFLRVLRCFSSPG